MTTFIASMIGRGVALLTPVADGTADQAMVTDGSGTLSFATVSGGVTDHGALTGLLDDDHTIYALLAGRAGGQTQYGGNAANDDYTIEGTSHATKTTSYVLLQPNDGNVGCGTTGPNYKLDITSAAPQVRIGTAAAQSGGFIWSSGANQVYMAGGYEYSVAGGNVARSTQASSIGTVNAVIQFFANDGLTVGNSFSPTERMRVDVNGVGIGPTSAAATKPSGGLIIDGNVGIGTVSPGGGSTVGTKVLSLGNGTPPVGGVADQINFYSADVSALAEAFVLDESGFATQLSAHDSDQLNRHPTRAQQIGVIPLKTTWTFNAHNPHAGIVTRCDVGLAMRAVERLWANRFGNRLNLIEETKEGDVVPWEDNQNKQRDARIKEQTDWDKQNTERLEKLRRRARLPFWMQERKPEPLQTRPDDFEIKVKPQWLVNAEAA